MYQTDIMSSPHPDPNGDIVLKCSDSEGNQIKSFRVSSKVLQLASPVFTALLSHRFREGQLLLHEESPEIPLEGDDAESLGLLLDVLHFQGYRQNHSMVPEKLASISVLVDKYDLGRAVYSWIPDWFTNVKTTSEANKDIAFKLLAAYMFNKPDTFKTESRAAIAELKDGPLWEGNQDEKLAIMPDVVERSIISNKKNIFKEMWRLVQTEKLMLDRDTVCNNILRKYCPKCQKTHPNDAKKCHACKYSNLRSQYCTTWSRISEYNSILEESSLSPMDCFNSQPFSVLLANINSAYLRARSRHGNICSCGYSCSLIRAFERLQQQGNAINEDVEGLCLLCIREEDQSGAYQECTHRSDTQAK